MVHSLFLIGTLRSIKYLQSRRLGTDGIAKLQQQSEGKLISQKVLLQFLCHPFAILLRYHPSASRFGFSTLDHKLYACLYATNDRIRVMGQPCIKLGQQISKPISESHIRGHLGSMSRIQVIPKTLPDQTKALDVLVSSLFSF